MGVRTIVEWPDSAFDDPDEAASVTRTALVDAAKSLGIGEPSVGGVHQETVYRSSDDGRFVTKSVADSNPGATTKETVTIQRVG